MTPPATRDGAVLGAEADADCRYRHGLARNYFSLVYLAQAIAADAPALDIYCVTSQLQSVAPDDEVVPEKAVLLGPCTVIPREYPGVSCTSIDIDWPSTPSSRSRLLDNLARELRHRGGDGEIALRGRDRWIRRYDPVRLPPALPQEWVRAGGTYVITGDPGGIALEHRRSPGRERPGQARLHRRDTAFVRRFFAWCRPGWIGERARRRCGGSAPARARRRGADARRGCWRPRGDAAGTHRGPCPFRRHPRSLPRRGDAGATDHRPARRFARNARARGQLQVRTRARRTLLGGPVFGRASGAVRALLVGERVTWPSRPGRVHGRDHRPGPAGACAQPPGAGANPQHQLERLAGRGRAGGPGARATVGGPSIGHDVARRRRSRPPAAASPAPTRAGTPNHRQKPRFDSGSRRPKASKHSTAYWRRISTGRSLPRRCRWSRGSNACAPTPVVRETATMGRAPSARARCLGALPRRSQFPRMASKAIWPRCGASSWSSTMWRPARTFSISAATPSRRSSCFDGFETRSASTFRWRRCSKRQPSRNWP